MVWNIVFFVLGCALLAELIYCIFQVNEPQGRGIAMRRPFGLQLGEFWGPFLRILLMVMMVALFYVACSEFK